MLAVVPLAASPDPLPTVQRAVANVIALVRSPEPTVGRSADHTMTAVERRAEIQRIAEQLFDFDEVGRRALWRHWAERRPDERAEFVRLFKALLARTYIGKIEMYSGEKITFVGERIDGTAATVMSRIVNGKTREATALDYRLHVRAGRWLVYDVVIDGVSFVSNYRSQFDRMIRESGYETMVQQLRLNVDQDSDGVLALPHTGAGQKHRTPSR
jgi:phospholipid transport system substrate-binding protein